MAQGDVERKPFPCRLRPGDTLRIGDDTQVVCAEVNGVKTHLLVFAEEHCSIVRAAKLDPPVPTT